MSIIPETVTPKQLAEAHGWSERYVRETARALGACLGSGRTMRLTEADVLAIKDEAANPTRKESVVYFIEAQGFIKIGWTTNWRKRLSNIQLANPISVQVLLILGRPKIFEKTMHAQFAQHWSSGEWFRDNPELRTFIREHQHECWYLAGRRR